MPAPSSRSRALASLRKRAAPHPDRVGRASGVTALNGWIALALYLIGLGLAFGFRAVVHLRRNGDTGFRLKAGPVGTASWWGKLLFAAALLLGLAGPVTQIVGIGRLTIPGGTIVEGIGLVLALLGMKTLLRAQREMGAPGGLASTRRSTPRW